MLHRLSVLLVILLGLLLGAMTVPGCSKQGQGSGAEPLSTGLAQMDPGYTPEAGTDLAQVGPHDTIAGAQQAEAASAAADAVLAAPGGASEAHVTDLWVDGATGDDANDGRSAGEAFRTIQRAADLAGPGTTVHILPGVYRETIRPANSGSATATVLYIAENGPGTVAVRGSEPAASLTWTRLARNSIGLPAGVEPANIYYTDLSTWGLDGPPRFLVELDGAGEIVSRLWPAREPDWQVESEWKVHEFWWFATGGSEEARCDPSTDRDPHCDAPWRSYNQLTDTTDDTDPAGVEPGNLTTLGNLSGATLVAMDAQHAHYTYRSTIIGHDVGAGRVTVDEMNDNDGKPGLGWGSKYYVENHPALLDHPGEWWFDVSSGRLYLWPPAGGNPAATSLEISRQDNGFDLTDRSYISLDGLTVELFNEDAYRIDDENPWYQAHNNALRNVTFRYANKGVVLYQYVSGEAPSAYAVDGFLLEDSEIAYMDTVGVDISFWWPDAPSPDHFSHAGVRSTVLRNNELHHLGFCSDSRSGVGVRVFFPNKLRFEGNHVHHVAQNGAHFHLSLVDSSKEYGLSPEEIKLGEILFQGNVFEQACQLGSDCGGLVIGGSQRPYTHVFRDVLVTGNVFRDTFGWSYVSMKRGIAAVGDGNGLYLDQASGVHAYRNIAYNNTGAGFKLACLWRDGDVVYYNNIAANNYSEGFEFTGGGSYCDGHLGSVNTQLANNIVINNDAHGIDFVSAYDGDTYGNLVIDRNLYYNNGWNQQAAWSPADIQLHQGSRPTQYFHGLSEIQAGTPWEDHGVQGDPGFLAYDLADYDRYDGLWPDFHVGPTSANVVDRGTTDLPASLKRLLTYFGIQDARFGSAFDIGAYEAAGVLCSPPSRAIQPGAATQFTVGIYPPSAPIPFDLGVSCPAPDLACELSSSTLEPGTTVTLFVTDGHDPRVPLFPGSWYTITIGATYGGATQYAEVHVLVGGGLIYLPLILK